MNQERVFYVNQSLTVRLNDPRYGGPQFVGKLFTEGLGRLPSPEEYKSYISVIEQKGCSVSVLGELAFRLFSQMDFAAYGLTAAESALAVYRAVLNRDPIASEVQQFKERLLKETAAAIAESFTAGKEFAALLPDIIKGPYYWGNNNSSLSPAETILKASDVQALLDGPELVIELPRGALVLVDQTIEVPAGKTLRTKDQPAHYIQKARLLRVANIPTPLVRVQKSGTLSHVWLDGNRSAYYTDPNGLLRGVNVETAGDGVHLTDNRINDATASTHLVGADYHKGAYIARNLLTCYATSHYPDVKGAWADGITHASTDSIIEDNEVADATDVGIIVFRYVSEDNAYPQTTIVRRNTVVNLGNSAYAGYDIDAWFGKGLVMNFVGNSFEDNAVWTSMKAHQHIVLSFAPLAWTGQEGATATGGRMINNYTPEGLYALAAAGIAVDGVDQYTIRGNQLNLFIGPWANESSGFSPRIISMNSANGLGELQGSYEDLPMHDAKGLFISSALGEPFASDELRHCTVADETYKE
ncbi:hypothetical protein [Paenibacillus baekrokdamisoli]|uniref:hypothetical protein n=1 Tax=Paenibacillus baekrokdamisoli TaxID=1712516 RepID=UPI001E55A7A7|nr:hypothetical protein [Paenibacillus baekrokdamisoli]